jgi:hypothetical protein
MAMRIMERTSRWRRRTGLALGATALVATYACGGSPNPGGVAAQSLAADQAGPPVAVACEAHQRTLVRQAVINGVLVSQVECVSTGAPQAAPVAVPQLPTVPAAAYAPAPAAYAPPPVPYTPPVAAAPTAARTPQPVYEDLGDARVVRTTSGGAAPVRTSQVIYEERRPTSRSTARSAVIIGSSAGAGAGVGAMVGGKKGALIGAAIGGGGAAVWDQATRRR